MTNTCSVIVTHLNCPAMLDGVVSHFKTHRHQGVESELLIADQSEQAIYDRIIDKYGSDKEIRVLRYPKIDAGYPIDRAVQEAKGEFCCTLDIDAFPIHPKWLYIPIRLIKDFGIGMIGHRTGLDLSYSHKGVFFELNNYFRVSRTKDLRFLSEQVGIMRPNARSTAGFVPKNTEYESCNDGPDKNSLGNYADTGVVANWYYDRTGMGTKLSLCLNKILGVCKEYGGAYGMVLDDLVFHLVLGYADDYMSKDQMQRFGEDFMKTKRLVNSGPTIEVIRSLVSNCKPYSNARAMTTFVDGKLSFAWVPKEIEQFIEFEKKST